MLFRYLTFIILLNLAIPISWAAPTQQYDHGNPTDIEQYMLELINRARLNPAQEGILLDSLETDYASNAKQSKPEFFVNLRGEFASYPIAQPLAFNPLLINSARLHSQDMITRGFFDHTNPDGLSPFDRIRNQGYSFTNASENIGPGADIQADALRAHFEFMVDHNNALHAIAPLGHRLNVLETVYTEVGVGNIGDIRSGYVTHNFGNQGNIFLLGVAYDDKNGNRFYDIGEGAPGVTITPSAGDYYAVTSASGGYAILLEPFETRTVEHPITTTGTAWTEAHAAADGAFRDSYSLNYAEQITFDVTAAGGNLREPITRQLSIVKPIKVNYQLVQTDGIRWTTSPLLLGNNNKLDFNLVTSSSESDVNTDNPSDTATLPEIGSSLALSLTGQPNKTTSRFYGGLTTRNNRFDIQTQVARGANPPQLFTRLEIDESHIGQQAGILLVIGVETEAPYDGGTDTIYVTINNQKNASVVDLYASPDVWIAQLADAFIPNVQLTETIDINLDLGETQFTTDMASVSYFFVGYFLSDGTLVYGNTPMILQVQ